MVAFGIVQGFQTQIHNSDSLMSAMQLQTNILGPSCTLDPRTWEVEAVLNPRAIAGASLLQKQFDHLVIVSAHSNCQRCQTLEPCPREIHQ